MNLVALNQLPPDDHLAVLAYIAELRSAHPIEVSGRRPRSVSVWSELHRDALREFTCLRIHEMCPASNPVYTPLMNIQ